VNCTRPVLRYHGGKFRLAPWLLQYFPSHQAYVEPFGGGASVLMRKPRVSNEVYNDLDSRIVNVFRVLRDRSKAEELRYRLSLTPYSRADFESTYEVPRDDVDAAAKTIAISFFGHGSDSATRGIRTGFRAKSHVRALPSMEWSRWPEAIPSFVERLQGVVIENRDALEIIDRYDTPSTLTYVDPPYLHSTRGRVGGTHGYQHEMSDTDHEALAAALRACRGYVIVSGYPSELYERLYAGWERHQRLHHADRGLPRQEVVWLNPACSQALSGMCRPSRSLLQEAPI
jgi:DNA adenine methylase